LIQRFEEGAALARLCQDRLGEAEGKVRRLEENLDGTLSTRPMGDDGSGVA
jgi:exonuclease VII small subunit